MRIEIELGTPSEKKKVGKHKKTYGLVKGGHSKSEHFRLPCPADIEPFAKPDGKGRDLPNRKKARDSEKETSNKKGTSVKRLIGRTRSM